MTPKQLCFSRLEKREFREKPTTIGVSCGFGKNADIQEAKRLSAR